MTTQNLEQLLNHLQHKSCVSCGLYKYRRNKVIARSVGAPPYRIAFIGEAPDQTEDSTGVPFYGPSGKLLDALIREAGIKESYIITNTVFCHPTDKIGGKNREPTMEEVYACMPEVMELLDYINASVYIFIGKVAEKFYGRIVSPSFTILHPSYLLRTGGKSSPHYRTTVLKLREGVENAFRIS